MENGVHLFGNHSFMSYASDDFTLLRIGSLTTSRVYFLSIVLLLDRRSKIVVKKICIIFFKVHKIYVVAFLLNIFIFIESQQFLLLWIYEIEKSYNDTKFTIIIFLNIMRLIWIPIKWSFMTISWCWIIKWT